MDLFLNHCFAEHDIRLDDVLAALRRERKDGQGKETRNLALRALREIERQRDLCRGPTRLRTDSQDLLETFLAAASPYDQLMAAVKRAKHSLNPIMDAIEAARHAVGDRLVVRHLLAHHITHAARIASKSALLLWTRAKGHWRKLLARASVRFPIRRANGFFGSDKVDGRNLP